MNEFLNKLSTIVGSTHIQTTGDLTKYEEDWRKRARGKALAVISPGTTREVSLLVKACLEERVSIVPQGGNTSMVVGSIPNDSGTQILLSMQRMNKVRAIDVANLTMTVESGSVLQQVQQSAEKAGFLFPLSLGSQGSCNCQSSNSVGLVVDADGRVAFSTGTIIACKFLNKEQRQSPCLSS